MGATCLYVLHDPATGLCTMAGAGHPPPAIVAPDGRVAFADLPAGTPIGIGLGDFRSVEMQLAEGSLIALYTDGLVETREAGIDHGLDRLRTALASLPVSTVALEDLSTAVVDTVLGDGRSDVDIALLVARTRILKPNWA